MYLGKNSGNIWRVHFDLHLSKTVLNYYSRRLVEIYILSILTVYIMLFTNTLVCWIQYWNVLSQFLFHVCIVFISFSLLLFFTFIAPCRITNTMHPWLYPGKATATARAALSSPSSVCDVFTVFAFCGAIGSFKSFLALPFLSMRLVCTSRGTPVYHASHSHPRARHSCPQTWWQSTVLSPGVLLLCNDQLL